MALNCKNDILKFLKSNPEIKNRILNELKENEGHHVLKGNKKKNSKYPFLVEKFVKISITMFIAHLFYKIMGDFSGSELFKDLSSPIFLSCLGILALIFNVLVHYIQKLKFEKDTSTLNEMILLCKEIYYDTIRSSKSQAGQKIKFENTYLSIDAMSIIAQYIDRPTFSIISDEKLTYAEIGITNEMEIKNELKSFEEKKLIIEMSQRKEKEFFDKQQKKKEKKEELLDFLYKE